MAIGFIRTKDHDRSLSCSGPSEIYMNPIFPTALVLIFSTEYPSSRLESRCTYIGRDIDFSMLPRFMVSNIAANLRWTSGPSIIAYPSNLCCHRLARRWFPCVNQDATWASYVCLHIPSKKCADASALLALWSCRVSCDIVIGSSEQPTPSIAS